LAKAWHICYCTIHTAGHLLLLNESKREGCRSLSPLSFTSSPPQHRKSSLCCSRARGRASSRMASFLSAKLGIKTTGQCSPSSTCKANEILCMGIKSCTDHAMSQAFGKKPRPLSDDLISMHSLLTSA
jgi:hypothetical protein